MNFDDQRGLWFSERLTFKEKSPLNTYENDAIFSHAAHGKILLNENNQTGALDFEKSPGKGSII
jgi:hypothetical protein